MQLFGFLKENPVFCALFEKRRKKTVEKCQKFVK
jgi:hypothetical protein